MTPERLYALSTLCFEEHLFPVYLAATAPSRLFTVLIALITSQLARASGCLISAIFVKCKDH